MRNKDSWLPSKYVYRNGKLVASRNSNEVAISSRLIADIVAQNYDLSIKNYVRGRLIDLGCGKIPLYQAYENYVSDVVCIDWGKSIHKNIFLDYECDLTARLPFSNSEFDTIILSDVLEHIPEPQDLWKEMSRILSKGGNVLLNVPFYYHLHEIPHDYYRYTEYSLRRFAESNGFKVLILRPIGGSPEIIADIMAKHFIKLPVIGKILAMIVQYFISKVILIWPVKQLSQKTGKSFPLGYFMIAEKAFKYIPL